MIRSNTHAFEILESSADAIPYEAIRYLYYQKPAEDIRTKVVFWLENAYNDDVLGPDSEYAPNTPFWYAILAENYTEESLIDPVIKLYTTTREDWDYLNEQGAILILKLCRKLGDTAVAAFLNKIGQQIREETKFPYLYLFEAFRFVAPAKYPTEILGLFEKKSYWLDGLLKQLPDMQFSQKKHPDLLAAIHIKLELLRLEYEMMEDHDHIDHNILNIINYCQQSLSKADYPNVKHDSYIKDEDWEKTLRGMEHHFEYEDEDEPTNSILPAPVSAPKKISRNAPCPCGSGKKYKRCCL